MGSTAGSRQDFMMVYGELYMRLAELRLQSRCFQKLGGTEEKMETTFGFIGNLQVWSRGTYENSCSDPADSYDEVHHQLQLF